MSKGTRIKIRLELIVPTAASRLFHKDLVARMHKYLSKWAVTVHAVDSEIIDD